MALLPLPPLQVNEHLKNVIDTLYSMGFKDSSGIRKVLASYETKDLLSDDLLNKIYQYKIVDNSTHTLNDIISKDEIELLKTNLQNPKILVVPNVFSISVSGRIYGYTEYRFYNFETKKLLFAKENSLSFAQTDRDTILMCGLFLGGMIKSSFRDYIKTHAIED